MTESVLANGEETIRADLAYKLLRRYGDRLTINSIADLKGNTHRVSLNYNKIFNIIDATNKKIYVRNIFFPDLFVAELHASDINIPIPELNRAINNQFTDLRNNLFNEVLQNKDIMVRILQEVHSASSFMSKFYGLLNELALSDVISKKERDAHERADDKYGTYVELLITSKLAELRADGSLKTSTLFKTYLDKHKRQPARAVKEAIAKLLIDNYDYIVHDLGLRHIKAYVDIVSSLYYLTKRNKLEGIPIDLKELYRFHVLLFDDSLPYTTFRDRVNALAMGGIFTRQDDSIQLAAI